MGVHLEDETLQKTEKITLYSDKTPGLLLERLALEDVSSLISDPDV